MAQSQRPIPDADICVDLHCHSSLSDGALSPRQLALRLADARISVAALADHDTLGGQDEFRRELSRHGIGFITAAEITTFLNGQETHLLAYDIDPANPVFLATLASIRQLRLGGVQSISGNLRDRQHSGQSLAPDGRLATHEAIHLIHLAGGKAILAHPFEITSDPAELESIVQQLVAQGLDGLEALYARYTPDRQQQLLDLCKQFNLLATAGSDYHFLTDPTPGVQMPRELWTRFRDRLRYRGPQPPTQGPSPRRHWRIFTFHIIFPTVLAIALFIATLWLLVLPTFERALLDRKREMIRELTNSAWSILAQAQRQEQAGLLSREQAQELAKSRIQSLRYGREGKDYFWLQDMHPRILMHPYRPDLNNQDVSNFQDPRGNRIFSEFADLIRRKNEGYLEYVWQWKDDPRRLVPKESYIRSFEPWGWIIGTGLYIEDVQEEIARVEANLVRVSAAISVFVALLLLYVMRESMRLERDRCEAEDHLQQSTERYRSLVEAVTEGALLVADRRCRYANPILLQMLGYTEPELELLDLADLLPQVPDNASIWQAIAQFLANQEPATPLRGTLRRRDQSTLACTLILRRIDWAGNGGFILLARPETLPLAPQPIVDQLLHLPGNVTTDLAQQIAQADGQSQITQACRSTPRLVGSLLDCGLHPQHITRMTAAACDAATKRLVQMAIDSQGPPPAPFVFLALGSQGRQEQTLFTDQDNAIVFDLPPGRDPAAIASYFLELGTWVCAALDQAGYSFCRGRIMASNPQWCQSLSAWKQSFDHWILKAQPQELLQFSIFFDFRAVCGQTELADDLQRHIHRTSEQSPAFFPYFAQNSLLFKPPLGLFGRIVTGGASSDHPGMLDLKSAMMPIVNFARLYTLKHQLTPTSTMDRLAALKDKGVLQEASYLEITTAYESLMRLRLRHQADAIAQGKTPDNLIAPHLLGHIERAILKESFAEIDAVQKRISYDFLGGT